MVTFLKNLSKWTQYIYNREFNNLNNIARILVRVGVELPCVPALRWSPHT